MHAVELSVCVPAYRAHAAPNLRTLAGSLPRQAELVVALNGISAGAVGAPPRAALVELPHNRGVAAGWNAAARIARGEVLVFANDDVVPGAGALETLATAVRALPAAGVVGARAERQVDRPQRAQAGAITATTCGSVYGFLFAVHRDVFAQVGGFDEAFLPCLWEEVDFCFAVRSAGLSCYEVDGLRYQHEFGISARRGWPWARLAYDGHSESLRSIRRRNRRRLKAKWQLA